MTNEFSHWIPAFAGMTTLKPFTCDSPVLCHQNRNERCSFQRLDSRFRGNDGYVGGGNDGYVGGGNDGYVGDSDDN